MPSTFMEVFVLLTMQKWLFVEQGHGSIGEVSGLQVSLLNPNWGLPLGMPVVLSLYALFLVFLNPSFLCQSHVYTRFKGMGGGHGKNSS